MQTPCISNGKAPRAPVLLSSCGVVIARHNWSWAHGQAQALAFLPVFTGGTCPPHILNWGGQSPPRFEYLRFIILLILLGAQALKQYSSMREAPKHATGKANVAKVCYKSCKLSPYFARCEDTLPQLVNCHCWTIACSDIW